MSNLVAVDRGGEIAESSSTKQFVTMEVDGQLFGIPVLTVQDILRPLPVTSIPLAQKEIVGSINLRGRIVTVVDMRRRMSLPPLEEGTGCMHVVADHKDEQYSFVVDSVGEVLSLAMDDFEQNPANLPENWQNVSLGVYRLEKRLLVVLDIESLLKF